MQGGKQLREIHWLCRHQEMLLVGHKVNKHTAKLYFLLKCFPNIYGARHVPPLFLRPWEGVFNNMQFSNILLKKFILFNNIIAYFNQHTVNNNSYFFYTLQMLSTSFRVSQNFEKCWKMEKGDPNFRITSIIYGGVLTVSSESKNQDHFWWPTFQN